MKRSWGGNYIFRTNHLKNFVFILCFISIKSISIVPLNEIIDEGSGNENDFKECLESFVGYQNTFLRGVKEENFITYDSPNFDNCVGKCCMEEKFNCTSFSYFSVLNVCYVMNLTQYDEHVQLQKSPGWTHYHKIFLVEGTTSFPEVTSLVADNKFSENSTGSFFSLSTSASDLDQEAENSDQDRGLEAKTISDKHLEHNLKPTADYLSKLPKTSLESLGNGLLKINNYPASNEENKNLDATTVQYTTEKVEKTTSLYNKNEEEMKEDKDLNPERMKLATNVKFGCSGKCENGGRCKYPETKIVNQTANDADLCECKPGFSGKFCQTTGENLEETGLPSHVVVGAVVGFVIFFLIVIVLVVFVVYRHKTGKYRVKFSRDKWRKKKNKNQPKRSDSFVSDMRQPPYHEGEQGSNDTLGSRSTASSV